MFRKNKKNKIIIQIIILNLSFIFIFLLIYRLIKGSFNPVILFILPFYAALNGLFVYLFFWYNENLLKKELFYFGFAKIPNQNYLKTLDEKYFKGDNFLLFTIILANHENIIKIFSENFFYELLNNLFYELKSKIKHLIKSMKSIKYQ